MVASLLAVIVLGLGSWLFRAGFIVFARARAAATRLDAQLAYVRPAVLAALRSACRS